MLADVSKPQVVRSAREDCIQVPCGPPKSMSVSPAHSVITAQTAHLVADSKEKLSQVPAGIWVVRALKVDPLLTLQSADPLVAPLIDPLIVLGLTLQLCLQLFL